MGQERLPERGRVYRDEAPDVKGLPAVIRAEDVVNDQDLPIVQRPYSNALTALGRQRVRPVERPRSQFVGVQVTGTDMEQGGTQLILARVVVLLHETDRLQRPQDSVHRALRKAQLSRHLDNPEAARPA